MDHPKDYYDPIDDVPKLEFQTLEDFLQDEYKKLYDDLNLFGKIQYKIQSYLYPLLIASFIGGYMAGVYFGTFWV